MKTLTRALRRQTTDAERLLWRHLRDRRLGGFKFRRQLAIEPYIVDFAYLESKLIVEADGGQHVDQEKEDAARTEHLERLGYRILRFWNHEILNDTESVLERVLEGLNRSPHPYPLPEGEGEKTASDDAIETSASRSRKTP